MPADGLRQVQVPGAEEGAEAKAKQKVIEIKEVKFRPGTDEGDYAIKMRNLRRFFEEGDKGKVTLRFRGREITHQDIGMRCWSASATSWPTCRWSSTCRSWKAGR